MRLHIQAYRYLKNARVIPLVGLLAFVPACQDGADDASLSVGDTTECPATTPLADSSCSAEGMSCDYHVLNACGADLEPNAICASGQWLVAENAIACDLNCPSAPPPQNSVCNVAVDGVMCRYDELANCSGVLSCVAGGEWQCIPDQTP